MDSNSTRIVSSEAEQLILVDLDDNELGFLEKADCHDGDGVLHRAFSLFLFAGDGRLLLQKRAAGKRLWPGFWSNSCCSHPRKGESMDIATRRRLVDELNISADIEFVYKFNYQASYGEVGSENELCSVYVGRSDDKVAANETEIAEARYISPADLRQELIEFPDQFTPWFKMEWQRLSEEYEDTLGKYTK
jgi:isopentenyl-diphosphate delta-isomerase